MACWLGCTRKKPVSIQITIAASTISRMPLNEPKPPGMRLRSRSWPLRMTSSMSGGRRDPNGPPPPRLPPPPPPPHGPPLLLFPPPPQGPPLLLFHAIHHLERRAGLCFHAGLHICDDSHTSNQAATEYCPVGGQAGASELGRNQRIGRARRA